MTGKCYEQIVRPAKAGSFQERVPLPSRATSPRTLTLLSLTCARQYCLTFDQAYTHDLDDAGLLWHKPMPKRNDDGQLMVVASSPGAMGIER